MQPQNNNLVTEIILGVVAGLIAIAAPILLYLGKVDFTGAMGIWALAGGLIVGKLALNAPSPSQQAQIGAQQSQVLSQQQQLQQLVSYALGMLPQLVQSLQAQAPVAPPQPQQTAQPMQVQSPVPVPVAPPVANPDVVVNPVAQSGQPQFKTPAPVPVVEHPPIEPGMMVNTLPTLPAFTQPQKQ